MSVNWKNIGQAAVIGAVLMGLITYASTTVSDELASIITAFPIGIIAMWFQKGKLGKFGYDTTLTNITVVIAYVVFDFLIKISTPHHALAGSIIAWTMCGGILHSLHVLK